jgi:hypothetical protein
MNPSQKKVCDSANVIYAGFCSQYDVSKITSRFHNKKKGLEHLHRAPEVPRAMSLIRKP